MRELDLHYTTVAPLYIGEQLLGLVFWGSVGGRMMVRRSATSRAAFWGAVVALVMLKAGLVDCEGWDVFSLWDKRQTLAEDWEEWPGRLDHDRMVERSSVKATGPSRSHQRDLSMTPTNPPPGTRGRGCATCGVADRRPRHPGALAMYDKTTRTLFDWPTQPDLYAMIKALHAQGALVESIRLMREHCSVLPRRVVHDVSKTRPNLDPRRPASGGRAAGARGDSPRLASRRSRKSPPPARSRSRGHARRGSARAGR